MAISYLALNGEGQSVKSVESSSRGACPLEN